MDYALRMTHDGDLFGLEVKQPMSLDYLKSLIHQGGRIYGDLIAHPPGRMLQGICNGNPREALGWPLAKGSARGSENHSFDTAVCTAMQALKDRVVLAVDREQPYSILAHRPRYHFARYNQNLLVCESDILTTADSGQGRPQTECSH